VRHAAMLAVARRSRAYAPSGPRGAGLARRPHTGAWLARRPHTGAWLVAVRQVNPLDVGEVTLIAIWVVLRVGIRPPLFSWRQRGASGVLL